MATSNSYEAPADFVLSAEIDDDDGDRLGLNTLSKCPLCHNGRKYFHCTKCVQSGEFFHTISVCKERYIVKYRRLQRLYESRDKLQDKCMQALEKHKQRDKLICDINAAKEKIKLLKNIESETNQNIKRGNQRLHVLKETNSQLTLRLPKHEEQIEKLRMRVIDLKVRRDKQKECVEIIKEQLKDLIRTSASQLIQYIFPLSRVEPSKSSCSSDDEGSIVDVTSALADASGTSYVRGKWINDSDNSSEVHHRIIAPTLPGSGDYSAYSLWVAQNKDGVPSGNKENAMHNPAFSITAALTYTTQLVNILAFYLDVRLPYKIAYSEFNGNDMSDQKFARKVAKLNSNILHLCFTQNTDTSVLHPTHTIQNLMHLLNTEISDLGRIGPIEVDSHVIEHLQNQLAPDLENSDDSASDEEEDAFNWEWEAVPNVACPEMIVPIPSAMSSQQFSSMQINQSVAGGLVTSAAASIASLWRGWRG